MNRSNSSNTERCTLGLSKKPNSSETLRREIETNDYRHTTEKVTTEKHNWKINHRKNIAAFNSAETILP